MTVGELIELLQKLPKEMLTSDSFTRVPEDTHEPYLRYPCEEDSKDSLYVEINWNSVALDELSGHEIAFLFETIPSK